MLEEGGRGLTGQMQVGEVADRSRSGTSPAPAAREGGPPYPAHPAAASWTVAMAGASIQGGREAGHGGGCGAPSGRSGMGLDGRRRAVDGDRGAGPGWRWKGVGAGRRSHAVSKVAAMERCRGAGKLRPLQKRGSLSFDLPSSLGSGWCRGTARGEARKGRGTTRVEATEQAAGVRFAGGSRERLRRGRRTERKRMATAG